MTQPRARRRSQWVDTILDRDLTVVAANDFFSLFATELPVDHRNWTLTRMILCYTITPTPHSASNSASFAHLGIGLAEGDAFVAGALPDPETTQDTPIRNWIYRCSHISLDKTTGALTPMTHNKDLRTRRRIENGTVFLSWTNIADTGGGHTLALRGIVRALYLV